MRIAILGATSQLASDLILRLKSRPYSLTLFSRRPQDVAIWAVRHGLDAPSLGYDDLAGGSYDALLNFVGVGNPARAAEMGRQIFEVTQHYDQLCLRYCQDHPNCRYVFLSSGAVYGDAFSQPVTHQSSAIIPINAFGPSNHYAAAKLYAECVHRSLPDRPIIDVRVFNYISDSLDIESRFFIADILRAIRNGETLRTTDQPMVRDFLHVEDFAALITALLSAAPANMAVDCYSAAPISKQELLALMQDTFGLQYQIVPRPDVINASGDKPFYYSKNRQAEIFGYQPSRTSAAAILEEARKILMR